MMKTKTKNRLSLENTWAKSTGDGLIEHTDCVIKNIDLLVNKYQILDKDFKVLRYSGILHDVGKIIKSFQSYIKTSKKTKFKFRHNIIGWYFINKYVNLPDKDKIANLVLWHHPNGNSCADLPMKLSDISKEISDSDLEIMKEFCIHYEIPVHDEESEEEIIDTEFYKIDNLLRSILITADVCASTGEDVLSLFENPSVDLSNISENFKKFLSSDRTKKQLDIIYLVLQGETTLIKAPTGFGKSILGIIFAIMQGKSVIWVCPTNTISESIYHDVISALDMMGLDISVELYLTNGQTKKSNKNIEEFTSKLIITNIDSFTKPSVSNSFGYRCSMIYDCPVIFDEPHEYDKMDCALNASYNNIMNFRHNELNSTTLLLTATEAPSMFLKQGGKQIVSLPSVDTHYLASHDEKYKVIFHDEMPWELLSGEFVHFSHTVDDVQENYKKYTHQKLIAHGRYLDVDKELKKNLVLDNYGKSSARNELGVFTNQLLTTACDYSVGTMFIKCPTIREFFQALGRLNRFGNMGVSTIHVILEKSKADETHIGSEDENELQKIFIKELVDNFIGVEFTYNELYSFYNNFTTNHLKLIKSISRQNLSESRIMLRNVFPKRYNPGGSEKTVANGNKMRQSPTASGIYILIKRVNSDEYVTMNFNLNKKIGFAKTFAEDKDTLKKQIKVLKKLGMYNKHRNITSEIMMKEAIFYDTPYVVFNYEYCEGQGSIKIKKVS